MAFEKVIHVDMWDKASDEFKALWTHGKSDYLDFIEWSNTGDNQLKMHNFGLYCNSPESRLDGYHECLNGLRSPGRDYWRIPAD